MKDIWRISAAFLPDDGIQVVENRVDDFFRLHWHEFYEIEYILSGSGRYSLNGKPYPAEPGTLFFFTYMDFHEIKATEPLIILNIRFDERWIEPSFASDLYQSVAINDFDNSLLIRLYEAFIRNNTHRNKYMEYMLSGVLIEIIQRAGKAVPPSEYQGLSPAVYHAMQYIHLHFREEISATDIAKDSGFSPNYFSTLFKEQTGMSIKHNILEHRVEYAKRLLRYTDLSITDICYVVGFNSTSSFFKAFTHIVGVSPRDYKRQAD